MVAAAESADDELAIDQRRGLGPEEAGDPGGEPGLQHRARLARVADDQHLRALGLGLRGRGAAQRDRKLGGQLLPGDPTDAVGSEELRGHSRP